jgi:catechol 2,3-dioxygenase-like lactoylglutathione lyase family enzyme
MRLKLAMIFVKDVERMTAFYRDGLGLQHLPAESSDGWVKFDAGGAELALHEIPAAIARNITISDPPEAREDGALKLVFETEDVDAARAHLAAQGAVMMEPANARRCDGLDPEGNVFTIRQK